MKNTEKYRERYRERGRERETEIQEKKLRERQQCNRYPIMIIDTSLFSFSFNLCTLHSLPCNLLLSLLSYLSFPLLSLPLFSSLRFTIVIPLFFSHLCHSLLSTFLPSFVIWIRLFCNRPRAPAGPS